MEHVAILSKIYIQTTSHIIRFHDGIWIPVIHANNIVCDFAIREDTIYVCENDRISVYNLSGKLIDNIHVDCSPHIDVLGDNIIVSKGGEIIVYLMEYCV